MNLDVEIYLKNLKKFFKDNPNELLSLIPKEKETEFYDMIRVTALDNHDKGSEVCLTKKQLLSICVSLNNGNRNNVFVETKFGVICYN